MHQFKIIANFVLIISHAYWENYWCYSYKIFPNTIILLHVYGFEGYSSQCKIDEMVNNHSNSYK